MKQLQQWLDTREPRERLLLILGAIVALIGILYFSIWDPLATAIVKKQSSVIRAEETLANMHESATEISRLRALSGSSQARNKRPLLSTIDATAQTMKLRQMIRTIKPKGQNAVQVWFDDVPFDKLTQWLGQLQITAGVQVESITVHKRDASGYVQARITLGRAG
ncbi:MAG TPA: type II secretion system protein M [Gammaproteobacteria bacterium]|nr:type II secretion system protein M [Gammaproteobacteria bacterium]